MGCRTMKSLLRLREEPSGLLYASETEHTSESHPGVRYVLHRCSLARRIALIERLAGHAARFEALRASERLDDRVQAEALRLRMDFEYLDWGLARVHGLLIDGEAPTVQTMFERGPESLVQEIVARIRAECELSGDERKN